jgi:hypothetical protein
MERKKKTKSKKKTWRAYASFSLSDGAVSTSIFADLITKEIEI